MSRLRELGAPSWGAFVASVILAAAVLGWLESRFVTRTEFTDLRDRVIRIERATTGSALPLPHNADSSR